MSVLASPAVPSHFTSRLTDLGPPTTSSIIRQRSSSSASASSSAIAAGGLLGASSASASASIGAGRPYMQAQQQDPSRSGQYGGSVAGGGGGAENAGPSAVDRQNQGGAGRPESGGREERRERERRQRPATEEIKRVARVHYQELLSFLRSHLAKEQAGPRSNAREKLTRLSKQQFTELSTDVYDELMRRQSNAKSGTNTPFLAVRDEFHPKRNQARQKLATLPKNRFKDLSSDVFFELERRFPELRDEFRPEAAAREREAKEREERQREAERARLEAGRSLSPEAIRGPSGSTGSIASRSDIVAQPSTPDLIIPAKSTLVEEEIEVPYANKTNGKTSPPYVRSKGRASDYTDGEAGSGRESVGSISAGAPDNRSTMFSQASSVGTGFFNGYAGSASQSVASPRLGRESADLSMEKLRSDYEFRIATLQQRVSSLESQNAEFKEQANSAQSEASRVMETQAQLQEQNQAQADRVKNLEATLRNAEEANENRARSLREESQRHQDRYDAKHAELEGTLRELDKLRQEHSTLQSQRDRGRADEGMREEFDALQREYAQQEDLVQELKGEVTSLLEELRQLSGRNEEMMADKDSDLAIIRDLNNQVTSYKRKYESAKTELRNLKATSQLYVSPPKADDFMPASESGAIADVNLTAFQSSIDELLAAARSKTPSSVLLAMKTVVLATTLVTDDVAKYEQHSGSELSVGDNEQLQSLKAKCSATLNNLMTACRNHASSHGMSPVSLLDAAASHVSTTIVDLVKLLKVRKASKLEAEESEATFTQEGRLQNGLKPLRMDSAATVREASPFSAGSNGTHGGAADLRSRTSTEDRRLNPSSAAAADERFSPRIRASPNLGRYSPIGYRPNTVRKDSNEVTWRARAASVSSTGSGSGLKPTVPASTSSPARSVTHRSNTMTSTRSGGSYQEHVQSDGQDEGEENWAELRNYIEVQTEAIVHSIQALLSAIREGAQGVQLNENLTQITTIVSSIVAISRENLPTLSRAEGESILAELTDNCDRLSEMQTHPTFDKSTKSAMASASYGVAKGLKALNGLLNDADDLR